MSAKTGSNIHLLFRKIAERLIEGKSPKEGQAGQSSTSVSRKEEKQQPTMALDAGKVEAETSKKQCQC